MKVLFIINTEDLGFEEPLGVLYLSAAGKKNGHEIYAVKNNSIAIEKEIKSIKPDLLAVSVSTPSFPYLFKTIGEIKAKYNIPAVFGGPHATFFPEIVRHKEIDYVFRGECDEAFVDFLDLLEQSRSPYALDNIAFKEVDGKMRLNPLRPLVSDLDTLPFPDRELLNNYKAFSKTDVRSVMASRGCPYSCSYCFNKEYNKIYGGLWSKLRLRSVDNVIEECLELKNDYNAKIIHFFDDIFPFRKDWIDEFADKYPKKVKLPFFTNTHFDICTKEYVEILSRAGCKTLLVGVETGNEKLREKILHRRMSNEMMINRSELIHGQGMKIYAQNLIGLPFGSFEKDLETLKLNIDLKADFAGAYLCQPYPKTEVEKMAKEAGLLDASYEMDRSFYYPSPLRLPDKKMIEKLRIVFSVIVNYPFLFKYTRSLLKLPSFLLKVVASFLHGYKIKTVVLRYRMSLPVFIKNIRIFFLRRINSGFHPQSEINK
jgi:anaerobic magnesium-protoporphyrin IX monomethyl ester cyclase